MAEIKYEIVGTSNFLRAAEYGMHIFNFVKGFEDKFLLAEEILIHFEESLNPDPNKPVPNDIVVSEDGKKIKVNFKNSRFSQPKGGMSKPSESDFFSGLRYFMENTVIADDNDRYEALNDGINNEDE
jgi:hypothetical protein